MPGGTLFCAYLVLLAGQHKLKHHGWARSTDQDYQFVSVYPRI